MVGWSVYWEQETWLVITEADAKWIVPSEDETEAKALLERIEQQGFSFP